MPSCAHAPAPEAVPAACLARILPHLHPRAAALTGGLAIHLHLTRAGLRSTRRAIPDIDLVASDPDVVSPSVTDDFLVNHYHLPQRGYSKFFIQLVDPVTRVRVDVFPDVGNLLATATTVMLGGVPLLMVEAGGILAHKLHAIAAASVQSPVDEKHLRDVAALARLLGQPPPAVRAACVGQDRYTTDTTIRCQRCEASSRPEFPLAAKAHIFGLLGYV